MHSLTPARDVRYCHFKKQLWTIAFPTFCSSPLNCKLARIGLSTIKSKCKSHYLWYHKSKMTDANVLPPASACGRRSDAIPRFPQIRHAWNKPCPLSCQNQLKRKPLLGQIRKVKWPHGLVHQNTPEPGVAWIQVQVGHVVRLARSTASFCCPRDS